LLGEWIMAEVKYKIDSYSVKIFGNDSKGSRTRWGDRSIHLYSEGKEIAQAVFAKPGQEVPEPYFSGGKIYYFADCGQFGDVLELLRHMNPVYIAWKPVHDPREPEDGDAFFFTEAELP
jgi:hypothetical protein